MMDILVAYATKHGSTQQVATTLAMIAREGGARVELDQARALRGTVTGRALVILGAPLYSGRWHRDAHRFLKRHRTELAGVPLAVFALGPRTDTVDAWHRSYAQLHHALGKHPWLHPVAVAMFGGVDPPGRNHPHRDLRDWPAIHHWATQTLAAVEQESRSR
jgi:menaquinone-dependent protoporphyrinogen oxidase